LQRECVRRGITFRKSWTKDRLRQVLTAAVAPAAGSGSPDRPSRTGEARNLSRAARRIVESLTYHG
jgi:hypothetical protein